LVKIKSLQVAGLTQPARVLQAFDLTKITNGINEALYQGVKFVSFAV
jgi:hypothetical protein